MAREFSRRANLLALRRKRLQINGAGEGNRTLVCSLEDCRSTIELRPPALDCGAASRHRFSSFKSVGTAAQRDSAKCGADTAQIISRVLALSIRRR